MQEVINIVIFLFFDRQLLTLCIRKFGHICLIKMVPHCSLWHFQDIPYVSVQLITHLLLSESFANTWWVITWFLNLRKINAHFKWIGLFPPRELWRLQVCHKLHILSSQYGFTCYKGKLCSLLLPLNRQQDLPVNRDGCVFETASILITASSTWEFQLIHQTWNTKVKNKSGI